MGDLDRNVGVDGHWPDEKWPTSCAYNTSAILDMERAKLLCVRDTEKFLFEDVRTEQVDIGVLRKDSTMHLHPCFSIEDDNLYLTHWTLPNGLLST